MPTPVGSASPSPGPGSASEGNSTPSSSIARHVKSALDKQRAQLERLLKDPSKPAYIPPPPKEKTIRPAREMMKNVQGSSAGAGSGEFHVYKASRRREYERLKIMDETTQKETAEREFEMKKRQWEEEAEAKTAKNRARRQKKKEKAKEKAKAGPTNLSTTATRTNADTSNADSAQTKSTADDVPFKKRRLVNGEVMVFRKPGEEESEEDEEEEPGPGPQLADAVQPTTESEHTQAEDQSRQIVEAAKIVIHEED